MQSKCLPALCLALLVFSSCSFAQGTAAPVPLTTEEATALVKGKTLSSTRPAGGAPSLQFRDDGTLYGSNAGASDSGKWRVEDGKLCLTWRRWEYEGCGKLVRVGDQVQHLYPDGASVHLIFKR